MDEEVTRSSKIIEYFLRNDGEINRLTNEERNDLMILSCSLLATTSDSNICSKAITILYKVAFLDDISLEEAWQIYWIINNAIFSKNINLLEGSLLSLYKHIYHFINSMVVLDLPYIEIEARNNDSIVIITNQFLQEGHAPTVRALDYSYTLQKHLNMKVIIINSREMNYHRNPQLEPSVTFNYIQEYSAINTYSYKSETFDFFQIDAMMPDVGVFQKMTELIYEINPWMVFNIGASNVLTDLCTRFTTTASLPCSYQIPVTCSKYLLLGRKLNDKDKYKIEPYQKIIETEINYIIRDSQTVYKREDFGINKDVFLISIIGNRLDQELTSDFIKLLNRMINNPYPIEIAIIGKINNENLILNLMKSSKVHLIGPLIDASEFLKESDLYVNPKRKGGGRSSFEALHYHVPVVTLDYGDVYYTCGKDFAVTSFDEMYELIIKYYNEKDFYSEKKALANKRALELSNLESCLRNTLDTIRILERDAYIGKSEI